MINQFFIYSIGYKGIKIDNSEGPFRSVPTMKDLEVSATHTVLWPVYLPAHWRCPGNKKAPDLKMPGLG